jgi:hypothetical protein
VPVEPVYIESVFSTYLYTGTGAAQTITNGIDLSTKGGMVWVKARAGASGASSHILVDTARGTSSGLKTDTTDAASGSAGFTSFDTAGFSFGSAFGARNDASTTYASWTFRKQPKFFDVVTYTGNGTGERAIAHNLGSVPGCVIVKKTSATGSWGVWHRGNGVSAVTYFELETTAAGNTSVGNTAFTSATTFTVDGLGPQYGSLNDNGATYVAYLFAHNAGGFGLTGTDNVISCGSYTGTGAAGNVITLGYEPQFLLLKSASSANSWGLFDSMRGLPNGSADALLFANSSNAEASSNAIEPTATGFETVTSSWNGSGDTVIYIAIRRGPMKVPTDATKVFSSVLNTGTSAAKTISGTGFPVDLVLSMTRTAAYGSSTRDRLRGSSPEVMTSSTAAEYADTRGITSFAFMDGYTLGDDLSTNLVNTSPETYVFQNFRRAPGFFDEVCYTGTGVARSLSHNLGVAPELAIVKDRNVGSLWYVQNAAMFAAYTGVSPGGYYCVLNTTAALIDGGGNYVYSPTTSTISVDNGVNFNTRTYVAYLFATCAGVSKVGSYTGNGTTQTIDCGFTAGARFVLIKRTDATGDWYTYDTARGMTVLTDPYLLLNSTAAETATLGSVTTVSTGFALNSTILAAINVSAGTYIFLAIA